MSFSSTGVCAGIVCPEETRDASFKRIHFEYLCSLQYTFTNLLYRIIIREVPPRNILHTRGDPTV